MKKTITIIKVLAAAAVVGEAMLAIALTEAWLEKFAGDNIAETYTNAQAYLLANKRSNT